MAANSISTSRRAVVAGLAAAPVAALPAVAGEFRIDPKIPDPGLSDIIERIEAANEAVEKAEAEVTRLEGMVEAKREALRLPVMTEADWTLFHFHESVPHCHDQWVGAPWSSSLVLMNSRGDRAVEKHMREAGHSYRPPVASTKRTAFLRRVIDRHDEACAAYSDKIGVPAAIARRTEARRAYRRVVDELIQTPARTLAGLKVKVTAAERFWDFQEDELFESIGRDILAMGGVNV